MFKKNVFLMPISSIFTSFCLFAPLAASVESDFMENAIQKIESECVKSSNLKEKALCFQNLEKWYQLLVKLNISDTEKLDILSKTKITIDHLRNEFQIFPDYFFANDQKPQEISVLYQGNPAIAFANLDQERYQDEVESYTENQHFKPITVNSLRNLQAGVHYNWVITLDGRLICAELQEYDELFKSKEDGGKKKILLSPNHALLANGEPVIAAGELKIIGDIEKTPVCWVAMTSGHYHPLLESRKHIENKLQEFVLPQQIVSLGFHLSKLPWKFLEEAVEK